MKRAIGIILLCAPLLYPSMAMAQQGGRGGGGQGGRGGGQGGQGVVGGVGTPGGRGGPAKPAPRDANGRAILWGVNKDDKALWLPVFGITAPLAPAANVPYQPWAKALFDDRQTHELEPHARCKASGVSRQFMTPYGVEFVELPEMERLYIFDVGGPHTYRTVYMDGRTHPEHLKPSYYGHSIGWWEGDTLFVDTTGFNESFWLDRRGMPHTEALHTLEKFTRVDEGTIRYEVTVDDPGAYTGPWTGQFNLRREAGSELFEYVCQQSNYATDLMVGDQTEAIGKGSSIVP